MNDLSFTQCCEDVPRLTPTVLLILAAPVTAPVFTSRSKNVNYCNVLYMVSGTYFTKYMLKSLNRYCLLT